MTRRTKAVTLRLTDDELARAHALAEAEDQSINQLLRRLLAIEHERRARKNRAGEHPES